MTAQDSGFRRGEVWAAKLPGTPTEKYYLVVSNDRRNAALGTALVVRITSSPNRPSIPTIVEIPEGECVFGRVLCDEIEWLYPEDVRAKLGAFSAQAMQAVTAGLGAAVGKT
ncbi:type II toxin-antitoxin system PemK/MazF family toxin [Leifsonia sp. NPDC058230]|uniref:type II toxin-antitoxin system PemK/MazF family toxin n=1 Tax=Leifsonia sp. NPDC058230 TaxID=3346391 RepID=UPI0036D90B54